MIIISIVIKNPIPQIFTFENSIWSNTKITYDKRADGIVKYITNDVPIRFSSNFSPIKMIGQKIIFKSLQKSKNAVPIGLITCLMLLNPLFFWSWFQIHTNPVWMIAMEQTMINSQLSYKCSILNHWKTMLRRYLGRSNDNKSCVANIPRRTYTPYKRIVSRRTKRNNKHETNTIPKNLNITSKWILPVSVAVPLMTSNVMWLFYENFKKRSTK